jgi:FkbM family methyltransferase
LEFLTWQDEGLLGKCTEIMKLKTTAKAIINRIVQPWGMELAYSHLVIRPESRHDWLKNLRIRTVLDIGANTGQFAAEMRSILPGAAIYSFEPLRDAYASLLSQMKREPAFKAFNFALGDVDAKTLIHRSRYSPSSSLLPMLELHKSAWPHTDEVGTEEIEVRQLDTLDLFLEPSVLVKMDVQGFEDRVIAGGRTTINAAACVITEVSFQMLYEGQPLFNDIYRMLRAMGFEFGGHWGQLPNPNDGRPLQADAIFIKPDNVR